MSPAYYLVIFNLVISLMLGGVIFFYQQIYPRRSIPYVILLLMIAALPLLSIWRIGVFESGDFGIHTKYLISFDQILRSGVFVPQWSADSCGGFGYPHFKYFYVLPYYLGAWLHALGMTYINSMKLLLCGCFLGSGLAMYAWLRTEFSERTALISSLAYLFTPHHLIALNLRHNYGELLGFCLVPLVLLAVKKSGERLTMKWWLVVMVATSLLILSHHVVPLLSLPLIILYTIWVAYHQKSNRFRMIVSLGVALSFSFLLTAWHWLPIIIDGPLIKQTEQLTIEFNAWWEYFFSPWKMGLLFQGQFGEISPMIGYTQLIAVVGSGLLVTRKIKSSHRHLLVGCLSLWLVCLVMMQAFTQPLWLVLPLVKFFQFAWRLLFVMTLLQTMVIAIVVEYFSLLLPKVMHKKKSAILIFLVFITVAYTGLNWGNRGVIADINDQILIGQSARCDALALPKKIDELDLQSRIKSRQANYQLLAGESAVIELDYQPQRHKYLVTAQSNSIFQDNTLYFPGWQVTDNGRLVFPNYQNPDFPGVMMLELSPGLHHLIFEYVGTHAYQLAVQISKWSFVVLLIGGWLVYLNTYAHFFNHHCAQ